MGWSWGFGYFLAGLWWLGAAFLVEADAFAWPMPLGVVGLPAALALFPAWASGSRACSGRRSPAHPRPRRRARGVASGCAATASPASPGTRLGMALGAEHLADAVGVVVGLYGLTLLAVAICAAPGDARGPATPAAALGALRLGRSRALGAPGRLRRSGASRRGRRRVVAGVRLRIMQPNLPQDAKFNAGQPRRNHATATWG